MLYTFAFYFAKNVNRVKIDLRCADVCAFVTMLMRVKLVAFGVSTNAQISLKVIILGSLKKVILEF